MIDLRTLTLSRCMHPNVFIRVLQPATSSSEAVACPKLEELVLVLHSHETMAHIMSVVKMAAARASRGEKLRTVRIAGEQDAATFDVSELRKHVRNAEPGPDRGYPSPFLFFFLLQGTRLPVMPFCFPHSA